MKKPTGIIRMTLEERELHLTVFISLVSKFDNELYEDNEMILKTFNNSKEFAKESLKKYYETRKSN